MDDFGTGYSSLSYLQRFPFDRIKIDRSFVQDLEAKPNSIAIIKAITDLGVSLGIATTAEGVETSEQLESLRGSGCTVAQGYLFSQAIPKSEIAALIASIESRDKKAA
jgi:EAL domain-containing protein (putative c-di-GMP-specific phosphodiesterase class I)